MNKKQWKKIAVLLMMIVLFSNTKIASAACDPNSETCLDPSSQPEDTMTPASDADTSGPTSVGVIGCHDGQDCVSLINPLATDANKNPNIPTIIGNAISIVMGIIGSITFIVFLYGGFLWLTSAGNSEKIAKGMQAMLWAGIGIIVVFSSYAILTLILTTLQAAP